MHYDKKDDDTLDKPAIYAYFMGLVTSATVMIGFILILKCCK